MAVLPMCYKLTLYFLSLASKFVFSSSYQCTHSLLCLTSSMGVTQKSRFRRNRFCRVTPAQFIRYLKSFYKANLDINKPLRLCVLI